MLKSILGFFICLTRSINLRQDRPNPKPLSYLLICERDPSSSSYISKHVTPLSLVLYVTFVTVFLLKTHLPKFVNMRISAHSNTTTKNKKEDVTVHAMKSLVREKVQLPVPSAQ